MDVQHLREATRTEHEATEAAMPSFGPGLTRATYLEVLRCLYPIVSGWEAWSAQHAPVALQSLLSPRRRSHLLLADLATLGAGPAFTTSNSHQGDERFIAWSRVLAAEDPDSANILQSGSSAAGEAAFLGAMYVMEGSTLGGRILARQVESSLGLASGEGDAYFQGHGALTGPLWKEVTGCILRVPPSLAGQVIYTARKTFSAFRAGLQHCGLPAGEST